MIQQFKYPLAKHTIDKSDIQALREWLNGYPRLTQGELVKQFEEKWSEFIGCKYSVFVNSGSSANLLMYHSFDQRFKNFIVPSVGWATTISPLMQLNKRLHFVDADKETFGLDLNQVEDILKKNRDIPFGIVFVHVLGMPHKKEIIKLADRYSAILLEDGCAAVGSSYCDKTNRDVGSMGHISTFSFYYGHQMSTIEGGMVCTNDKEIYEVLLMLRSHGWMKDITEETRNHIINRWQIKDSLLEPFTFVHPGFNVRSTDLNAFLGLRQLQKINQRSNIRYANHLRYHSEFQMDNLFQTQKITGFCPSIHFGVVTENILRKHIVEELNNNRIETRLFSAGNLVEHPFVQLYNNKIVPDLSMANKIHSGGFFLPNNHDMNIEDVKYISGVVKHAVH